MKKTLILLSMFVSPLWAQTTYYSDQNGLPIGTAQRVGNTTYYSNANGLPVGTAQQVGNTTYYSNSNGLPVGTAQSPQTYSPQSGQPINNSPAPTFPPGPLFPSSPRGM